MCPGCGTELREGEFLCMQCATIAPDSIVVQIGAAIDSGDTVTAEAAIGHAVEVIRDTE